MSYLAVFAVLSLLIVVHEAGHLLAARLVGLPPRDVFHYLGA